MVPRLEIPKDDNKYYIRKSSGGYSPCIKGNPLHAHLDALANCVGYAVGRFNEIGQWNYCRYLGSTNAEDMATLAKKQGLTVSGKPVLGGCMVWAKGKQGDGSDGAGHVAIVEMINEDGSIITSESGYGYKAFYTTKRSGPNWGQSSSYSFIGCIVNPAVLQDVPKKTIKKGDRGAEVLWLQKQLSMRGYLRGTELDGDFGKITLGALLAFQFENGLKVDGVCGDQTKGALLF